MIPMDVLDREMRLVERMVRCACNGQHGTPAGELCVDCAVLLVYVRERVAKCPYGARKPVCRKCPIHCYQHAERARIKEVMRYAGPRLLAIGDPTALAHLLHGFKKALPRPGTPPNTRRSH